MKHSNLRGPPREGKNSRSTKITQLRLVHATLEEMQKMKLSQKVNEVLCAAGSGAGQAHGLIVFDRTIGSAFLIAGNLQWEFADNPRSAAEYEEAIEELSGCGLARWVPQQGYFLTAAGYRLAESACG